MSEIAISVRDLTKSYTDGAGAATRGCEHVSFDAYYGEAFGLLGTNGAGKTTILRVLSTVLRPTSGEAIIAGHSVLDAPESVRASIGFLSASTGVYGRLSAREMIHYFGRLHGLTNPEVALRIEELTGALDMRDYLDRRCEKLSSGQKQRVNIARTIIHDPEVLILDEATTGLDILAAKQIIRFIKEYRGRGRCIILSTHIMHEAEQLCDRVLIIHDGVVRSGGTLTDLRKEFHTNSLDEVFLKSIGEEVI